MPSQERREPMGVRKMTFEEANELDGMEMMDAFDIGMEDNICQNCCNRPECNAPEEFHKLYPSDTITSCDFFERW